MESYRNSTSVLRQHSHPHRANELEAEEILQKAISDTIEQQVLEGRAPIEARVAAVNALHRGSTADQAIAAHGLSHPADIDLVHSKAALLSERFRLPRADPALMIQALGAIGLGASAPDVVARYFLSHPQDSAEIWDAFRAKLRRT